MRCWNAPGGWTIKWRCALRLPRSSFMHVWLKASAWPLNQYNKIWPYWFDTCPGHLPSSWLPWPQITLLSSLLWSPCLCKVQDCCTVFSSTKVGWYFPAESTALQSSLNIARHCLYDCSSWEQSFWWQSLSLKCKPFARGGTTAWQ